MKPFATAAFAVLLLAGLAHAVRLLMAGFEVTFAGHALPRWAGAFGAIIAFDIAYQMRKEAKI